VFTGDEEHFVELYEDVRLTLFQWSDVPDLSSTEFLREEQTRFEKEVTDVL
jgi:hypothetical protein